MRLKPFIGRAGAGRTPAARLARLAVLAWLATACWGPAWGAAQSRHFTTSDGVRLHYLEAGPQRKDAAPPGAGRTLVFVPGWTMPAWIFERQMASLSRGMRVVALDPRSQGQSEIAPSGHDHVRRGRDIAELLARLGPQPVVLVGWSLGVLDALAFVRLHGDRQVAGLVLIDNSVGEEPAPVAPPAGPPRPQPPREVAMRSFVRGMFATPQPEAWLERLAQAALRTPDPVARQLLAYPVPRTWWREALYSTTRPVLYMVRPKWTGQAQNVRAKHPSAEVVLLDNSVGHALFVDDPAGFEARLTDFLRRRVWP
jgi:microsomal epoxide hydrolase